MTKNDYMLFLIQAIDRQRYQGDKAALEMAAEMLCEYEVSLDTLRKKGWALIGMSLIDAVGEVPEA